ncbi:hypothetical protein TrVFT333_007093 [Trichoderma virens FT-333]|nr:hypothetical protein TrVFT333_007093 [Trichoderma virens FT-333]
MASPDGRVPELADDADDDEALRYAIALSLQDGRQSPVVIDDSDDDDEATASSARSTQQTQSQMQTQTTQASSQSQAQSQHQSQFGALMLDRKAMEQERLNRLAKRQRPPSDDDDDVVEIPPPKKQAMTGPEPKSKTTSELKKSTSVPMSISSSASSSLPLQYPNGTVKRTWSRGCARTGEEITIEEVFQKDQLELAVLSSFQWDEEWMMSKLDIRRTKILLLAFAKDEAQPSLFEGDADRQPRIEEPYAWQRPLQHQVLLPPMHGPGAMHSKLQLLKYPDRLRVVIPTGNLVPLGNPATHPPQRPTGFYTELVYFLQSTGVGDKMVASLSNYDFSKTSDIAFVHTIPGSHSGNAAKRTGWLTKPEVTESSDDGIEDYKKSSGTSSRSRASKKPAETSSKELKDRFRIYFPTDKTVARSRGGRNAGGTICVQARWWRSPSFPTELVRDVITRDRLLIHSKMIFVRRVGDGQATRQPPGWAYVGSANLSESAW